MKYQYAYEKDYVENHLIAYIGNKRRLIPLILKAIREVESHGRTPIDRRGRFVDFFSGTGVVSRLAKSLGYSVIANDWETYSYVINKAFIESDASILDRFEKEGGLDEVLRDLNRLEKYRSKHAYISKYYCPRSDEQADASKERLFYTRENGILIDNIRERIDVLYEGKKSEEEKKKKYFLLSLLLYEASVRANTNGVFKGFHDGFGGRKQDALSRIKKKLKLIRPALSVKKRACIAMQEDALVLAEKLQEKEIEIAYLDPPYNQHQYGSNYHLLNTIALNDKPPVRRDFMVDGKKVDKAAIRKDWVKTRSPFCYKDSAKESLQKLVERIHAKYLLISYSTEGIVEFDTMLSILSKKGKIGIVTMPYVRFRGGRQSLNTKARNIEFVLIVDTHEVCTQRDIDNVQGVILRSAFNELLDRSFPVFIESPAIRVNRLKEGASVYLRGHDLELSLNRRLKTLGGNLSHFWKRPFDEQQTAYLELKNIFDFTNDEEIRWILTLLADRRWEVDRNYFIHRLVTLFNKIHPEKNAETFDDIYRLIAETNQKTGFLSAHAAAWGRFERIMKFNESMPGAVA